MSTPRQVADNLRRRAQRLRSEMRRAEGESIREAHRQAVALSSGPLTERDLIRLKRPYRHGGSPPMHPGVINVRRGVFRAGWRRRLGSWGGGAMRSRVFNASDVARFMRGTKRMQGRPIWSLIARTIRPVRRSKLRAALRRALHG